jgi:hypothetical protein
LLRLFYVILVISAVAVAATEPVEKL